MTPRLLRSLWIALFVYCAVPAAWAGPQVTVELDRTHIQLGQPIQINVRLYGCDGDPTIEPPAPTDIPLTYIGKGKGRSAVMAGVAPGNLQQIQNLGSGQHLADTIRELARGLPPDALPPDVQQLLNDPNLIQGLQAPTAGQASAELYDHVFAYQAQPQHTGTLTLPAFTLTVSGKTLTTRPVALTVDGAKPQDWVRTRLALANPAPLVGEETELYVDMFVPRKPVSVAGRDFPCLPFKDVHLNLADLDRIPQIEFVRALDQYAREHAVSAGQRGMRINTQLTEVLMEREPPDLAGDPNFYRRRLTFPVRIRAAGHLEIPAATVSGEIYVPGISAGKYTWQTFVASSEALHLEVRDLAGRKDRPQDFTGAIGKFRLSVHASQTTLPVGTPFTLTVRVEGQGSLPHSAAPDLARQPEFTQRFRVRQESERVTGDKAREFTYTLRPLAEDVTDVPAVRLSYFDPAADRFETTQTQPITLTITPATHVAMDADNPATQEAAPASSDAPPWQQVLEQPQQVKDWAWQALPWAGAFAGVCIGGCVLRRGLRWWRQWRPAVAKPKSRPRETASVRRRLQAGAVSAREVRQALSDYLRARFGMPEGELTPSDVRERLSGAGVSESLSRECGDLLEVCAAAEFGAAMVGQTPIEMAQAAKRLMGALERPTGRRSLLGRLALAR